jgi:hypothetical protein
MRLSSLIPLAFTDTCTAYKYFVPGRLNQANLVAIPKGVTHMTQTNSNTESGADRRRTERKEISYRIEVCGCEPKGTTFLDETTTIDVNEHGCKFDLAHPINRGDLLTIRHIPQEETATIQTERVPFQVVWAEVCENGWTVGAMKLLDKSIWPMNFSALPASKNPVTQNH